MDLINEFHKIFSYLKWDVVSNFNYFFDLVKIDLVKKKREFEGNNLCDYLEDLRNT